ncbi:YjbE family putative metal transport protein [Hephaestia sp. GCM10023244]|uniref:YjbE family putative metal transport protein n=1 Tax=unclassified Hephaestia TaxID=2631281 RepID=UPI002076E7EB|nr:YjbE family putative metal transport protein [Hephaestia sp. MAHUQ-44]MCM8731151.1 YjbE family putative metal transport protein [Hephaestia sp. MAHUQ-44]
MDIASFFTPAGFAVFVQVVMIDLVLAGDNAVVVGTLAAGLPRAQQKKVVLVGVGAALVLRIIFALIATQLLQIVGLLFAGGLLLLWVSWKMWRDLRAHDVVDHETATAPPKSFARAAWAVALADVSMSLDNVLGVAGAARDHPSILVFGLILSVAVMGLAASLIARVVDRYRWIAYVGLAVIVWVAFRMIYEGLLDHHLGLIGRLM